MWIGTELRTKHTSCAEWPFITVTLSLMRMFIPALEITYD